MFNVVLLRPQIPQNTGSIGRICVNTNCSLHLIKPMCFELDDKMIKRAGLDYWPLLELNIYDDLEHFLSLHEDKFSRFFFSTTKSKTPYFKAKFQKGDYLFFGGESTGLPMDLMQKKWENALCIPMGKNGRSLNQSVAVGIILHDAIRQNFEEFL